MSLYFLHNTVVIGDILVIDNMLDPLDLQSRP